MPPQEQIKQDHQSELPLTLSNQSPSDEEYKWLSEIMDYVMGEWEMQSDSLDHGFVY